MYTHTPTTYTGTTLLLYVCTLGNFSVQVPHFSLLGISICNRTKRKVIIFLIYIYFSSLSVITSGEIIKPWIRNWSSKVLHAIVSYKV